MSSLNTSETSSTPQGVSWNEEDWQDLLKRLPAGWQEQAFVLKAFERVRKVARVADLLRALLVYAACGYGFAELGSWATLVGVGCLSERAWRKRVEKAQPWIAWLLEPRCWQRSRLPTGSRRAPGAFSCTMEAA